MYANWNIAWLRKAAEQGQPEAQFSFALCCAGGQGMPRDRLKAYFWLLLASMQVPAMAARARDEIQKSLTPQQCAQARVAANHWKPS